MTLQEKLRDIKKTSTLNKLNEYPVVEFAEDLDDLWEKVIEPNLPDKSAVIQWHNILMSYVRQYDTVLSLRAYGSPSGNSPALRRGFLNKVFVGDKESFNTFFVDNFFTAFFFSMAKDGYAPKDLDEFKQLMDTCVFPCGCIQTSDERELAAYYRGTNPEIGRKGYKIAHIFSAGEDFNNDAGYNTIGSFCSAVFPRGDRSEWSYSTADGHTYRRIDFDDYNEAKKVKNFAIAHFLRTVHPINYFLVPNKPGKYDNATNILKTNIYWHENGIEHDEIGEYPALIEYVAAKIRARYGKIYDEFLSLIYPTEQYINPIDHNVRIDAEYAVDIWYKKIGSISTTTTKTKTRTIRKYPHITIELIPSDPTLFKNELLSKKQAKFKLIYDDGRVEKHTWAANKFSPTSDLLNNIKSRLNHRPDRDNIVKAIFEV